MFEVLGSSVALHDLPLHVMQLTRPILRAIMQQSIIDNGRRFIREALGLRSNLKSIGIFG